jgi:signal transduction histidine kinase
MNIRSLLPAPPRSLRGRIALASLSLLTGWVAVLTLAVNLVVAHRLDNQADELLRARAGAVAASVSLDRSGSVVSRETAHDSAIDVAAFVVALDGRIVVGPRSRPALASRAVGLSTASKGFPTESDADVRWYVDPVQAKGRRIATVVTFVSLEPYRTTRDLTLAGTVVLALLLLAAAWLALRASIGRALLPVTEMTHQAARWSADNVDRRFGQAERPVELEDLAATLDGVLDRLGAVLRHERRLSDEISHELRTPMARILAEVELLRDGADRDPALHAALATIEHSAREMTGILETLMTAARSGNQASLPGRCDAAETLRTLVAGRPHGTVTVAVDSPGPVRVGIDAAILTRAVSPLLDNAERYATSRVDVRLRADRDVVRISVVDDGPAFAEADLGHVFEPGRRGSDPDSHPGAGLGLALVRRLVTAAGGTVTAANTGTGAAVEMALPPG